MASTTLTNPSVHTVASLLPKLSDADADFRFMSLTDLFTALSNGHPGFLAQDYNTSARTVEGILKTLEDSNGEVQNLAIKCLGPLVLKVPPAILAPLVEKLSNLSLNRSRPVHNPISATALRTVVVNLPRPIPGAPPSRATEDAFAALSLVLIPRLVGYVVMPGRMKNLPPPPAGLLESRPTTVVDAEMVDVLIELTRCYGPMLRDLEIHALQKTVMDLLENERVGSVAKKRAVVAISVLAVYFSDEVLSAFVSQIIESFRNPHLTQVKRRLLITIVGSLARSIPTRFGPYLMTMAPFILSAVSAEELADQLKDASDDGEPDFQADEVREAALIALEGFLAACSAEMRPYTEECISAAIRFLTYDPNFANDDDDDMAQGDDDNTNGFDGDEDFEEEAGFSDDDDLSWKVRRCAAKVIYTLISTRASGDLLDDGTLYDQIAPVLVERFKEREENVRLEVLSTMSALIRRTGGDLPKLTSITNDDALVSPVDLPPSRKRRRGGSDASMFDTQAAISLSAGLTSPVTPVAPPSGPRASLVALSPDIIRASQRLLKQSSIPTRQGAISLLKDLVGVQRGGLSDYLNQLVDPIVEAIKLSKTATGTLGGAMSSAASATASTLRLEALILAAAIAETHPSSVLQPHLAKLVPAVTLAVGDKFYKVSGEALFVVEQLVKALTPPRSTLVGQQQQGHLERLYEVVIERVAANDADLEVRQRGIHCLGVMLARTSSAEGSRLLSPAKREHALRILSERLRNELTRLSAVRAIDTVATLASNPDDFSKEWTRGVALELGAQLRKANRALRGASLAALKNLVANPVGRANLEDETIVELIGLLSPLLTANDLHLLGPALVVLTDLIRGRAQHTLDGEVVSSLTNLVLAPLGGAVLDALLILVRTIGEERAGKRLMAGLLKDVGVNGDPAVVGKVIGTLLVAGESTVGVKLDDFSGELQSAKDDRRKCLALSVLGEAAYGMGACSPLQPSVFIDHFASGADQVGLAAAIALGRAGAGNTELYIPAILSTMSADDETEQYLLLHSIKEILQYAGTDEASIGRHSKEIWEKLLVAAQTEDNKAVGAECIGRLAIVEPKVYLPQLQSYLQTGEAVVRGMVIQALRYTLADMAASSDEVLKPVLVDMLTTMLNDGDLENRRLAMTTLNSAARNKPDLMMPHLGQLLPLVMKESNVKAELIREVQMGPFKHKVDDGLEVRKSAYETLYALMETAFARINVVEFYDRVIAGLADEHDIRILCNLMLTKLIALDADETVRRLDAIAEKFRAILSFKPKDTAVKQELEKVEEASKGVLRVSVQLHRRFPSAGALAHNQTWRGYWEWVRKDFGAQLKSISDDEGSLRARQEHQ